MIQEPEPGTSSAGLAAIFARVAADTHKFTRPEWDIPNDELCATPAFLKDVITREPMDWGDMDAQLAKCEMANRTQGDGVGVNTKMLRRGMATAMAEAARQGRGQTGGGNGNSSGLDSACRITGHTGERGIDTYIDHTLDGEIDIIRGSRKLHYAEAGHTPK